MCIDSNNYCHKKHWSFRKKDDPALGLKKPEMRSVVGIQSTDVVEKPWNIWQEDMQINSLGLGFPRRLGRVKD